MLRYNARDLLNIDPKNIWDHLPDKPMILVMDDGEIVTHARHTIFSHYCWWPQRIWQGTPLLVEHHIGNSPMTGDVVCDLMEKGMWLAKDMFPEINAELMSLYAKQNIQLVYNDFTYNLEEWVVSINAMHFIEVLDLPGIREVNEHLQSLDLENPAVRANAKHEIAEAQAKQKSVLLQRGLLRGNRLIETVQTGIYSIGQVLQCVGPRGLGQDIDGNVFEYPIMYGFAQGIHKPRDSAIESRSAALALMLAKAPLSQVEYFNREMQLVAAPLCNLYREDDCGSTEYVAWTVQRDNLKVLNGLYYKLLTDPEDAAAVKWVKPNSTELIGKTILLRTALTCKHHDSHGICGKCFGRIARSVPDYTNIGHVSVVELCARVSQNVLSTKHLVASAIVSEFVVQGHDARYIRALSGGFNIGINPKLDTHRTWILINKEQAQNIADIHLVTRVDELSIDRISSMSEVTFLTIDEDGDESWTPVVVGNGSRQASLTAEFLSYMVKYGYDVLQDGYLKISLNKWDRADPIWALPKKHASTLEFLDSVKSFVKSDGGTKNSKQTTDGYENVGQALIDFYDTVSRKFPINVTHLAVILRSTMIRSAEDGDYRFPVTGSGRQFGSYKQLMRRRSLAAWCAHQEQSDMPEDPSSYLQKDRPWHPFDCILVPPTA